MEDSFYVVWQPETGAPRYRHDHPELAQAEARRLSGLNPGKKFYVLRAESVSYSNNVTTEKLSDALPF